MKYLKLLCWCTLLVSCQKKGLGTTPIFSEMHLACTSIEGEAELREISLSFLVDGNWLAWEGEGSSGLLRSVDEGRPAVMGTWVQKGEKRILALDERVQKESQDFLAAWDGAEVTWSNNGWQLLDVNGIEYRFWRELDYQSYDY